MRKLLVLTFLALGACGADGDPVTPTMNTTVGIGVGVGSSGTHVSGGVGLHRGPVSVFFGL